MSTAKANKDWMISMNFGNVGKLHIAVMDGQFCGAKRTECIINGQFQTDNIMPRKALDMSCA